MVWKLLVVVALAMTTGCGPDRIAVDDLPVPASATDEPLGEGAFEVPLDLAISDTLREFDFDEQPDQRLLALPDDIDPEQIIAFYTSEFDDYSTEGESMTGRNTVRAAWRNGDQLIVVAVIDAGADDPMNFLVLFA